MCIVVIGPRGSGKTTLGKALAEKTGLEFMDTSEVLIEKLSEIYKRTYISRDHPDQILEDKVQNRGALVALGNMLCDANPAYLWQECRERGADIVGGIRRKIEVEAIWNYSRPDDLIIKIAGPREDGDNYELENWSPEDPSKMLIVGKHPDANEVLKWVKFQEEVRG